MLFREIITVCRETYKHTMLQTNILNGKADGIFSNQLL
jgi:hypothetical protein